MKSNKLCQHFICPQFHLVQKNFQTPQNLKPFSIISTKLEGGLKSILGSFGQFLLIKINLLKLFNCKSHLLRFVSLFVNEKIFSISIFDPKIPRIW